MSATYFWPCQSHASLAPSCAVADVARRRRHDLDVVAGHPRHARDAVARVRPRPREDACRLHRGLGIVRHQRRRPRGGRRGAPVEDDRQAGACAVVASGRARLGSQRTAAAARSSRRASMPAGRIVAWDTQMWIPTNRRGARILLAAQSAGIRAGQRARCRRPSSRTAIPAYAADHVRVLAHWMRDTPLNPSNLRAPGKPANVFAVEGFTDEIAAALRVDPLEFRVVAPDRSARARGAGARSGGVRLAAAAGAESRRVRQRVRCVGRGVAYTRYKQAENYVAIVHGSGRRTASAADHRSGASSAPTTAAWSSIPMRCGIRSRAESCRRSAARCTRKCSSTSRA